MMKTVFVQQQSYLRQGGVFTVCLFINWFIDLFVCYSAGLPPNNMCGSSQDWYKVIKFW